MDLWNSLNRRKQKKDRTKQVVRGSSNIHGPTSNESDSQRSRGLESPTQRSPNEDEATRETLAHQRQNGPGASQRESPGQYRAPEYERVSPGEQLRIEHTRLQREKAELEKANGDLKRQYQAIQEEKQKIVNDFWWERRELQDSADAATRQAERQAESKMNDQARNASNEKQKMKNELNGEIRGIEAEARKEILDLEERLRKAEESRKHEVHLLLDEHSQTVASLLQKSSEQDAEIAQIHQEGRDEINELRLRHEEICVGWQKRVEAASEERERLVRAHEAQVQSNSDLYEQHKKKQAHETELQMQLQADRYKTDRDNLVSQHHRVTRHLNTQVEELNTALLARDDEIYCSQEVKALSLLQRSDGKLREAFAELEEMVDYLGRLPWSPNATIWSNQDLRRLSGQQETRALKKAIVQDLVWCRLYHSVFASPFRLFDAAGARIEKEWLESCGQHLSQEGEVFVWPEPSARRERWRYMTLSRCREILTEPVLSEYDPRARVKKAFSDTRSKLAADLKSIVVDVAPLNTGVAERIDKLSAQAMKTWLELQLHRCRILVGLTGTGNTKPEERIDEIRRGSVQLTVTPSLGRYGNNKGSDLGNYTMISAGDVLVIP